MNDIIKLNPTVCVVGKNYQIMIKTEQDALISIRIGNKTYYDHCNGVRKSLPGVHRISVPTEVLDKECSYTVVVQKMMERLVYFPKIGPELETKYNFRPVNKTKNINIYHLADVHGNWTQAIGAARKCNKQIDLLILNGDISSAFNTVEDITLCYRIASEITKGEIPCIISRGNHELRGDFGEKVSLYMPGENGKSYYTFKVGCIWGIIVDAGGNKVDSHPSYGGTLCCHDFRLEQEKMIENTIKNASDEYEEEDVKYKIIISHIPFTFKFEKRYNIERDLFARWSNLLKENIKPNLMICGHTHIACVSADGSEFDDLGQPCTIIVGSDLSKDENANDILAGALITLKDDTADIMFNSENMILHETTIQL